MIQDDGRARCLAGTTVALFLACLWFAIPSARGGDFQPGLAGKALIEWGYDRPSDTHLIDELGKMEANVPFFDGVVVDARRVGEPMPKVDKAEWRKPRWYGNYSGATWGREPYRWEPIAPAAKNFAALRPTRFKELFIRFNVTPGDVDWFDEAWSAVAHNAKMTGRLIREGKLKGMMLDTEEYGKPLFYYPDLPGRSKHTLEEYQKQVRQRGREFITALNSECVNPVIIFSFAHSHEWPYNQKDRERVRKELKGKPAGPCSNRLIGPFIDGMLEAGSPGTEFYDGYERGYNLDSAREFIEARRMIKDAYLFSFVPDLYKKRMKVAFGLWFDRDWRKRQGFFPDQVERNYYSPQDLACKVNLALQYSDRYVWLWSESVIWWSQRLRKIEPPKSIGPYLQAMAQAKTTRPYGLNPQTWQWKPQTPATKPAAVKP